METPKTGPVLNESSRSDHGAADRHLTGLGVLRWLPIAVALILIVFAMLAAILTHSEQPLGNGVNSPIGQAPQVVPEPLNNDANSPHLLKASIFYSLQR